MVENPTTEMCHGLGCNSTDLIDAHIVPQGHARFIRDAHHNLILSKTATRKTPQLGDTDRHILCGDCDRQLGAHDEVLIAAARDFRRLHKNLGQVWVLPSVDADKFAKAVFAILWRASISRRSNFASFSLGRYEERVRDILFGKTAFTDNADISMLVQRYTSKHFDTSKLYTYPSPAPFEGLNSAGFALAGLRILAKFDPRPLPTGLWPFDVPHVGIVRGAYIEFEKAPEFDHIAEMVANDMVRSARQRS